MKCACEDSLDAQCRQETRADGNTALIVGERSPLCVGRSRCTFVVD